MTARAIVQQSELARYLREAKKQGWKRVSVTLHGDTVKIDIYLEDNHMGELISPRNQPTAPGEEIETLVPKRFLRDKDAQSR